MAIPAYYSLIQRGSSGPDVALVQTWLNGIRDSCTWYAALTVDGRFGAKAEKAVREFQLRYGLAEDGKVGANTWNVLYARYTAKHGLTVPYPGIVLRSGSAGGCVRLVQQKLNAEGERLTTDGSSAQVLLPPSSAIRPAMASPPTARWARPHGRSCSRRRDVKRSLGSDPAHILPRLRTP